MVASPSSSTGDHLEYLEGTFEGTQKVSRLIIRTLDNDVDKIKKGNVTLFGATSEDVMSVIFQFSSNDDCVMAINFSDSNFTTQERNVIDQASKFRITIDAVRAETQNKRGFKADLFVEKK